MIAFGIELAWLALRVTIVAAVAIGLVAWSGRRGARSAVVVLTGTMVVLLMLALAALEPLPDTWRWTVADAVRLPQASETAQEAPNQAGTFPDPNSGETWLFANAMDWLRRWSSNQGSASHSAHWGWGVVTAAYLLGIAIGCVRLLIGWRQLGCWRRRSRAITDVELLALAESLSARLSCGQAVELREVDDFGPAATLGWRQPVILLGTEWRGWSVDERRAVLAHELAHVRHRDFLFGLITGLCRALYFYHPLVRWLAAQMHLRQEVAADDAAAAVVGDRPTYLKALARLALRLPARMPVGASVVLPAMTGGILLWRIHMLCRTEQRPMHRMTRGLLIAFLSGVAVLVSTWRGPAQAPDETAAAVQVEPFDLGYLVPDAKGLVAVRPAVWMAQPGMDRVSKKIDDLIKEAKMLGFTVPEIIRPENIEQIVANLHLSTTGTGKPGSRSVNFGTSSLLIRFHKEVDGPSLLKPFLPDMKEVRKGNLTLHHLGKAPMLSPLPVTMFQPDRRTMVFVADKNDGAAEKLVQRVGEARRRDWGTGWKDVKQAAFAVVVDNSDGTYIKMHEGDLSKEPEMKEIVDSIRFAAIGIELGDGRPMRVVVDAKSADAVKKLETAAIKLAQEGLAKAKQESEKEDPARQVGLKLATDFVNGRQVRIDQSRLEWLVFSPLRLRDFIGADGLPLGAAADGTRTRSEP